MIHLIFLLVFVTAIIVILGFLASNEQKEQISALNTQQAAVTQTESRVQTAAKRVEKTKTQQLVQATAQSAATQTHLATQQLTHTTAPTLNNTLQAGARPTNTATLATPAASTATPDRGDLTTIEPSSTPPAVATDTPAPTETEVFTPIDWTGNWTAFFGQEGGVLFRATLVVSRIDNTIVGLHSTQKFTGILSADGLTVIGTWVNPPTSGSFYWSLVSENQFCGNTEKAFAYCAARSGATRPDPCFCRPTTD